MTESLSSQVTLIPLDQSAVLTNNYVSNNNEGKIEDSKNNVKAVSVTAPIKFENEKKKKKKPVRKNPLTFIQARKRRKIETTEEPSVTKSNKLNLNGDNKITHKNTNETANKSIESATLQKLEYLASNTDVLSSKNATVEKQEQLLTSVEFQNGNLNKNSSIKKESNSKTKEISTNIFSKFFKEIFFPTKSNKSIGERNDLKCIENSSFYCAVFPAFLACPSLLTSLPGITSSRYPLYKVSEKFKLKLAASHIDDAIHGRGKYGKARACLLPPYAKRCFSVISTRYWTWLLYLTIAIHSLIILWEQPTMPVSIGEQWPVQSNGIIWQMNPAILVLNGVCVSIYFLDIILHSVFMNFKNLWLAKESVRLRVECIFSIFFLIDYVILISEFILQMRLLAPFRLFRASMLLCKSENVAHIFDVLRSIFIKLGKVIAIIVIFIFVFASIGLQIFMDIYHELPQDCCNGTTGSNCSSIYAGAFDNIGIATLHMFVLMSTENYPEVIIPAFSESWGFFFFFGIFLYAGVFFLTAILLAIIVESYWEYSKKHVKIERRQERAELAKAWNLLDPAGTGSLKVDDPKLLELFKILRPKNSDEENLDLITNINDYNDDTIDTFDWTTRLIETLLFEFEAEQNIQPRTSESTRTDRFRKTLKRIMHSKVIGIILLVFIIIHSILFSMMWYEINRTEAQLIIQSIRFVIVILFVIEVIFRCIADGKLMLNVLQLFDIAMVVIAVVADIVWCVLWSSYSSPTYPPSIDLGWCVVVASLAVIGRLLVHSHLARTAFEILQNIYPVMFDLTLLVFAIIYCYAVIGFEAFQDKTLDNTEAIGYEGSYVEYDCGVGFETLGCSLLIVFQIITTNDWHEIMLGALLDAGGWSVIYFVTCYLMVDMVVMNLFVAISIEAYKKLAKHKRDISADKVPAESGETEQNNTEEEKTNFKDKAKQGASVAKSVITEIFTPTRHSHNTTTVTGTSPYPGRRGTRGSLTILGSRNTTPAVRRRSSLGLRDSDSDDDGDDANKKTGGFKRTPETPRRVRRPSLTSLRQSTLPTVADQPENEGETIQVPNLANRRKSALIARMAKRKQEKRVKQQQIVTPKEDKKSISFAVPEIIILNKSVRILKTFRARSDSEMSVMEGDIVMVTKKKGSMYEGPYGFFPFDICQDHENFQNKEESSKKDSTTTPPELSARGSIAPGGPNLQHRHSQARMVKQTRHVEWRRQILGDMTVMNRDEMQELNKQFKSGLGRHHPKRVNSTNYKSFRPVVPIMEVEQIVEEEEPERVPVVTVSEPQQFEIVSNVTDNDSKQMNVKKDTLTLPGSSHPRQKTEGVPQWAKQFAKDKNVSLGENVITFDQISSKEGTSDEEEGSINLMVHRSNSSSITSLEIPSVAINKKQVKEESKEEKKKDVKT